MDLVCSLSTCEEPRFAECLLEHKATENAVFCFFHFKMHIKIAHKEVKL